MSLAVRQFTPVGSDTILDVTGGEAALAIGLTRCFKDGSAGGKPESGKKCKKPRSACSNISIFALSR